MNRKHCIALSLTLAVTLGVLPMPTQATTHAASPTTTQVGAYATLETASYNQDQLDALAYINNVRKQMGLEPVTLHVGYTQAAMNHSKYLALNNVSGHGETPGKPGFTGDGLLDRLDYVGVKDDKVVVEGVSPKPNNTSITKGTQNLLDAPYHRAPLISDSLHYIGIGRDKQYVTQMYGIAGDFTEKLLVYPYDGQTNVRNGYSAPEENPNHLEKHNLEISGYIISVTVPEGVEHETMKFTLKNSSGVESYLYTYYHTRLEPIMFVTPKNVLKYNEKYTASVDYIGADGQPKNKTWSFTTKSKAQSQADGHPHWDRSTLPDFEEGKYWSDHMIWAIERDLINGTTSKHPTGGYTQTLLAPNGVLTESQFLTMLFRYTNPRELASTTAPSSWWASKTYQLASQFSLPLKGSLSNQKVADSAITRGDMARIFVSKHLGKTVGEKEAVEFLIANGISNQQNYQDYLPNKTLTRGEIVTFLQRYDQFVKKN